MASSSLIPLLYGGCMLVVLGIVGLGAVLYVYGRRQEAKKKTRSPEQGEP